MFIFCQKVKFLAEIEHPEPMGWADSSLALVSALLRARGEAGMTQEEVAKVMGTTQAVGARLESEPVMPSTRTLQRFAKATKLRLRISFEPSKSDATAASR